MEKENPKVNLLDWVKDVLKDGIELWSDERSFQNDKGVYLRRDVSRLRSICLGVISVDKAEDWYRICRLNCPVGTVIEPYKEDEWKEIFEDVVIIVRAELTKCLLEERSSKSAKTLLDILSKRDKNHWSDNNTKTAEIKKGDETIKFVFEGM